MYQDEKLHVFLDKEVVLWDIEDMRHIVFFHSEDLDGECSAAIAEKFFIENKQEFELRPYRHYIPLPMERVTLEDRLYFLDIVSDPYSQMQELLDAGYDITICDHHASFLKLGVHLKTKGLCDTAFSACELTWKYFFGEEPLPMFIHLLGRYDIHDDSNMAMWNSSIDPFQYGMRTYPTNPLGEHYIFNKLFMDHEAWEVDDVVSEVTHVGEAILKYQKLQYMSDAENSTFEAIIDGWYDWKFLCMNTTARTSLALESKYDPEKHDGMFFFSYDGLKWMGSFRTTKDIDLTVIARAFGGGGHKQACGFQFQNFKFGGEFLFLTPMSWVTLVESKKTP